MDKLQYLSAVQEHLLDLPEDDIRTALDYYMDLIDNRMREGLSEEEAVAQLPDPRRAARQIRLSLSRKSAGSTSTEAALGEVPAAPEPPAWTPPPVEEPVRRRRLWPLVLLLCLGLCAAALFLMHSGTGKGAFELERRQASIDESFTALSVELSDAALSISRSSDGRCALAYEMRESDEFSFAVEDGVLKIRQRSRGLNPFAVPVGSPKVELRLPQAAYETAAAKSVSGSITLEELRAEQISLETGSGSVACVDCTAQQISLKAGSGSVRAADLEADKLTLHAGSGSLSLRDLSADSVLLEVSSGSIRIENVELRTLRASSSSGSLRLKDCRVSERAALKSGSGSIRFEDLDAGEITAESVSGSIRGSVVRPMRFEASSTSGSVKLPASEPDGGLFRIETTSGSIHISVT